MAPFPSVVLLPGQILFGLRFNESVASPLFVIWLATSLYKLARLKKFSQQSSIWLVLAFLFGSVMINLIVTPFSWYYAQVIATTLLTALLLEYETKKRFWVLGLLEAMIIVNPSDRWFGWTINYFFAT